MRHLISDPDDPESLHKHLAAHLRPDLIMSWKKRRNTMLVENAEKRRRLLDRLQKHLDEVNVLLFLNKSSRNMICKDLYG